MKQFKFNTLLVSALCLTSLLSCQKEELQIASTAGAIRARVSAGIATKSSLPSGEEHTRTIAMDEDSLMLQEFVSDNLSQPFNGACPNTKGTVVDNDNITTYYGAFGIECFLDNYTEIDCKPQVMPTLTNGDQYIADGIVSYDTSDTSWDFATGYNWLWEMKHIFWSYAPQTHSGTYSYGSAGSRKTMTIANYSSPAAAADQKDLLIAYNYQQYGKTQNTETLDIKFRHALADVRFDVSAITTPTTVTKIEIIGAYSKGNCSVAGADLADEDVTKAFTWSSLSTAATFTMTSTSDHFFMIPQTLPSGTKIKITMDKSGTEKTSEVDLTGTWKAGKYYKYKLTYNPATYSFSLKTASDATTTFGDKHTTESKYKDIVITSTKKKTSETTAKLWDWDIQSYQIGSGAEVPVEIAATSVTAGDFGLFPNTRPLPPISSNSSRRNGMASIRADINIGSMKTVSAGITAETAGHRQTGAGHIQPATPSTSRITISIPALQRQGQPPTAILSATQEPTRFRWCTAMGYTHFRAAPCQRSRTTLTKILSARSLKTTTDLLQVNVRQAASLSNGRTGRRQV